MAEKGRVAPPWRGNTPDNYPELFIKHKKECVFMTPSIEANNTPFFSRFRLEPGARCQGTNRKRHKQQAGCSPLPSRSTRTSAAGTSNITDMDSMFYYASMFNQDIDRWNTSNVTNMHIMFTYATLFNHDLSRWCVADIPLEPTGTSDCKVTNSDVKHDT